MKLFNGIIEIASAPQELTKTSWSFEVGFKSNDGFRIEDMQVNDIVFLNAYDINTDLSQYCRFVITSIENGTKLGQKRITVRLTEELLPNAVVYAPYEGDDNKIGLVGRQTSELGFTFLPSVADGATDVGISKSRNLDFKNRDTSVTTFVTKEVKKATGSGGGSGGNDSSKLPLEGGTITGDLTVENQTTLNRTKIKSGDNVFNVTPTGITTTLSGSSVTDTKTVSSSGNINSSISRVSNGRKATYTDLVKGSEGERNIRTVANGDVVSKEEITSEGSGATKTLNVSGVTTNIQINSQGTTSSTIGLNANSGEIGLTAKRVNVVGAMNVSENVTFSKNVTSDKVFSNTTDENFVDNQLITKKYANSLVTNVVSEKLKGTNLQGISRSDVEAMLAGYLTTSTANVIINNALASISPTKIQQSDTYKFVSSAEIASWNAKQDKIPDGYYIETAQKGLPKGVVPLNEVNKIDAKYLNIPQYNESMESVPVMDKVDFDRKYNGNVVNGIRMGELAGSLFIVVDKSNVQNNTFNQWHMVYIYRADAKDVTDGVAQAEGQQLKYEFGMYYKENKLVDWKGIGDVPNNIVYSNSGKISENLLPEVGQKTYAGITFDKFGRAQSYNAPTLSDTQLPALYPGEKTFGNIKVDKYGRVIGTI